MTIKPNSCFYCEHYMRGYYNLNQTKPGNVCGNKKKEMHSKVYPNREYYYKTEPHNTCADFKKWNQTGVKFIYGNKRNNDN